MHPPQYFISRGDAPLYGALFLPYFQNNALNKSNNSYQIYTLKNAPPAFLVIIIIANL